MEDTRESPNRLLCQTYVQIQDMLDSLRRISPHVTVVQGHMDDIRTYERFEVVEIGDFKVGVCHGRCLMVGEIDQHDEAAVAMVQRKIGADILVMGDSSKGFLAYQRPDDGGIVVCPGSATGWSRNSMVGGGRPSFALMDIKGNKVVVYSYVLNVENELEVDKVEFTNNNYKSHN